jgi:hypothetical protein
MPVVEFDVALRATVNNNLPVILHHVASPERLMKNSTNLERSARKYSIT